MPPDRIRKTFECTNGHLTWVLEDYNPKSCPYMVSGSPCDGQLIPIKEKKK